jgi:transposase, IS5 family
MATKQTGQFSFVEALLPQGLGGSGRLDRLSALVKWYRFDKLLAGLRSDGPGRPGYPALLLFKALLLQALYGLSDPELEEALGDRLSFRRFVGLGLVDTVPDHSTLCRFRLALIEAGLLERLFAELDRQLDRAGVMIKRGTMLDATLIETGAAARPPRAGPGAGPDEPEEEDAADRQPPLRDGDARFARRSGKPGSTYGYKAHVGVDCGSGLIRAVITTAANVNDTVPADRLIRGDEREVWADAAYHTQARQAGLRARGIKPRLARRANRHHPTLPPRLRRYNQLIARRRAAVETTFATWKRRMHLTAIRYIGLAKAAAQVLLVAMAFNMRRWVTLQPS